MKRAREDEPRAPRHYDGEAAKRARPAYEHSRGQRSSHGNSNSGYGRNRPQARDGDGTRSGDGGGHRPAAEVRTLKTERETDPHRLAQRQKQIDYGKNTLGYDRYCAEVPKHQRRKGEHPMTPDKTIKTGKKHFDSMVRRWRQALHKYDPPELVERLQAAEQEAMQENATSEASVVGGAVSQVHDDPDLDPELADLDPSSSAGPSIFDTFNEASSCAGSDDDDDLL